MIEIIESKLIIPISSMAKELGVGQRTLRIYDEENILSPERSNTGKYGRRRYKVSDISKGKFIIFLMKDVGMNIAGVKIVLALLNQLGITVDEYMDYIKKIISDNNVCLK